MSDNRSAGLIELTTPLGANVLLVESLEGREALSELFTFRLNLLAPNDVEVDFRKLVGADVSLRLRFPGSPQRVVHGMVSSLQEGDQDDAFTSYRAVVVPRLWRLIKQVESRIFQRKSVLEVLEVVLAGIEHSTRTTQTYRSSNYIVQYNESNFDFASRLMEEAGLYYYFASTEDGCKMMIADDSHLAPALPEQSAIPFVKSAASAVVEPGIRQWRKTQEVRAAAYSARDYTHDLPNDRLEATQSARTSIAVGDGEHDLFGHYNRDLEITEYPGSYAQMFDPVSSTSVFNRETLQQVFVEKQQRAQVRVEEEAAQGLVMDGAGNLQHLTPGFQFDLSGHFRSNGSFLIAAVEHRAQNRSFRGDGSDEGDYQNTIRCLPIDLRYRTPRKTPKPRISGPQTATVVGPPGETIHTDLHGRIKVQLHWDRQGKFDGDSSCWIRVAQQWAGKGFGFQAVPRVGHEVIVDFLNGDPDRPIAIGSVYNATNPPPHKMPDYKHRTAIKSRSVPASSEDDVGGANSSGILFDDTYGAEHMQMHSERHRTDSTESLHFVNAGVGHHTHVGSMHTHQVGGWRGLDHAQGPATVNWTNTCADNRAALIRTSGSGSGGSGDPSATASASAKVASTATETGTATDSINQTSDFSGNYSSTAVSEAAASMSTTFGLNSEIVFGNLNEFVLGQAIESYINPYQFAGTFFPTSPFLAFGFAFAVGYGQTWMQDWISTENTNQQNAAAGTSDTDDDSDSASAVAESTFTSYKTYQKQAAKLIKAIYKKGKQSFKDKDLKRYSPADRDPALNKISKEDRDKAAKNQAAAREESQKLAQEQTDAAKAEKDAGKSLGKAQDKVDDAKKKLGDLEKKLKNASPSEKSVLDKDITKAKTELENAEDERDSAWENKTGTKTPRAIQKLDDNERTAKENLEKAKEDLKRMEASRPDDLGGGYDEEQEKAREARIEAQQEEVKKAESKWNEAKNEKAGKNPDGSEKKPGADENLKKANDNLEKRRADLKKDYEEKKLAAQKAKEEQEKANKEASRLDDRVKDYNLHEAKIARKEAEELKKKADGTKDPEEKKKLQENAKRLEEKAEQQERAAKINEEDAEKTRQAAKDKVDSTTKDENDAHDKYVAGDTGEQDVFKSDSKPDNPKCGDFTGIGGYSCVYIGTYAQITYGDVFSVNRGTPQTTVTSPPTDQPTAAKCMMILYSLWEVASTVIQSLEPQNDAMAESYSSSAGMMQNTIPTFILQVWMATEYAGQIADDAATSGEQVEEKAAATAVGGSIVKIGGEAFMATCARTWVKYEKYILWAINIISTGVSVGEGIYSMVTSWDKDSNSGSGSGSLDDEGWLLINSGSGGSGFSVSAPSSSIASSLESLTGDVADNVVPHVVDATTGYVINSTTVQINTTPDLETEGDSLISLMATGGDESPGQVQIYGSGNVILQGGTMTYISLSTSDAETGSVSISCGEDGVLTLGNGAIPTNNLTISAESNILTAGENVLTHNEDGFIFEVGDTEVCITEEGIEFSIGAACITMSDDSITLSAGGAALVLSSEGITLEGAIVDVTSEGDFNVTADACSVEAIGVSLG